MPLLAIFHRDCDTHSSRAPRIPRRKRPGRTQVQPVCIHAFYCYCHSTKAGVCRCNLCRGEQAGARRRRTAMAPPILLVFHRRRRHSSRSLWGVEEEKDVGNETQVGRNEERRVLVRGLGGTAQSDNRTRTRETEQIRRNSYVAAAF